jgi:hypothetical protein
MHCPSEVQSVPMSGDLLCLSESSVETTLFNNQSGSVWAGAGRQLPWPLLQLCSNICFWPKRMSGSDWLESTHHCAQASWPLLWCAYSCYSVFPVMATGSLSNNRLPEARIGETYGMQWHTHPWCQLYANQTRNWRRTRWPIMFVIRVIFGCDECSV